MTKEETIKVFNKNYLYHINILEDIYKEKYKIDKELEEDEAVEIAMEKGLILIKLTKTYNMVYLPERVNTYQKEALKRLNENFKELKKEIQFTYPLEDKGEDFYPDLEFAIQKLETREHRKRRTR